MTCRHAPFLLLFTIMLVFPGLANAQQQSEAPQVSQPQSTPAGIDPFARKSIEKIIRPGYERLAKSTAALKDAAASFCAAPAEANQATLKAAYEEALLAWSRVEMFRFGPVTTGNMYDRFAFWPDEKGLGLKQITAALAARDESVTNPAVLAGKSVALQGFTALEYLLYGTGSETLATASDDGRYRCRFVSGVTQNLANMAEEVHHAWSNDFGFAGLMFRPNPQQAVYKTPRDVKLELFKSFTTGLQSVRDVKLARVLGEDPASAQPKRAPYWRSGLTFKVLTANLEALSDYFALGGFSEMVGKLQPGIEKSVVFDLNTTRDTVRSFGATPVDVAVKMPGGWNKLNAVIFELATVQRNSMSFARAADLSLGFNALDGD